MEICRSNQGSLAIKVQVRKLGPSRPGEFHPEPLTEPDLNLSAYPARTTHRKTAVFPPKSSSSGCPLTRFSSGDLPPSLHRHYPVSTLLRSSPPLGWRLGTFGLTGLPLVPFPLPSPTRFSSSVQKPRLGSRHLYTGHRMVSKQVASMLLPDQSDALVSMSSLHFR